MDFENGLGDFLSGTPVIGGMFDDSRQKYLEQIAELRKLMGGMDPRKDPYQWSEYRPEDFNYSTVSEDPYYNQAAREHLNRLSGLASTGMSAEDELRYDLARRDAANYAKSQNAGIEADMARRGLSSSGQSLALKQMAAQGAAERNRIGAMQAASDASGRQRLYSQAYGDYLDRDRSRNMDVRKTNADIMNRYGALNAQERNKARLLNIEKPLEWKQRQRSDERQWANDMSGVSAKEMDYYAKQGAARDSARQEREKFVRDAMMKGFGGM